MLQCLTLLSRCIDIRYENEVKLIIKRIHENEDKVLNGKMTEEEHLKDINECIEDIVHNDCLSCEFNQDNLRDNIPEPDYIKEELD